MKKYVTTQKMIAVRDNAEVDNDGCEGKEILMTAVAMGGAMMMKKLIEMR